MTGTGYHPLSILRNLPSKIQNPKSGAFVGWAKQSVPIPANNDGHGRPPFAHPTKPPIQNPKSKIRSVMVQVIKTIPADVEELKTQIKRLNSKAGQMKMDLHDLAEGLPTNFEQLMDVAAQTYQIYRQLDDLKKQLKQLEHKT
jgi:hypothetical protein